MHRAAHLLANPDDLGAFELRRAYRTLLAEVAKERGTAGLLGGAAHTFLRVTTSYWPGLFHCYAVPGLPRTNNELEHFFGSARYHERRATGRKVAAPGTVVRGSVRLVAAVATRSCAFQAADLQPADLAAWRTLRQQLEQRHAARRAQFRFRRDPARYLDELEEQLLKSALPS